MPLHMYLQYFPSPQFRILILVGPDQGWRGIETRLSLLGWSVLLVARSLFSAYRNFCHRGNYESMTLQSATNVLSRQLTFMCRFLESLWNWEISCLRKAFSDYKILKLSRGLQLQSEIVLSSPILHLSAKCQINFHFLAEFSKSGKTEKRKPRETATLKMVWVNFTF